MAEKVNADTVKLAGNKLSAGDKVSDDGRLWVVEAVNHEKKKTASGGTTVETEITVKREFDSIVRTLPVGTIEHLFASGQAHVVCGG